jgi:hypothetical protein
VSHLRRDVIRWNRRQESENLNKWGQRVQEVLMDLYHIYIFVLLVLSIIMHHPHELLEQEVRFISHNQLVEYFAYQILLQNLIIPNGNNFFLWFFILTEFFKDFSHIFKKPSLSLIDTKRWIRCAKPLKYNGEIFRF